MDVNIPHFTNKIRFYVIYRFRNIMRFQFAPLHFVRSIINLLLNRWAMISLLFFKTDNIRVLEIF